MSVIPAVVAATGRLAGRLEFDGVDVGDSIHILEIALRDLIQRVLKRSHGEDWFEHLGVTIERIQDWERKRGEEPKRRPGGEVEQRLLYYAEFFDLADIIRKNWASGFKECFGERKRFDV